VAQTRAGSIFARPAAGGELVDVLFEISSHSGVWRVLKRLELNRLPASQRYKHLHKRRQRYEKQLPGHRVQIDMKFALPFCFGSAMTVCAPGS